MNRRYSFPMALIGAMALAGSAAAQPSSAPSLIDSPLVVNLGTFVFTTDLKARLNGQSTSNPDVDFDKAFGLGDNANRVRADALWRITPRHHLRFLYFDNSRTNTRTLDQAIKWGDLTFQPGSNVSATNRFKIAEVAYEYAFWRKPDTEVAGSIGVHYADISLKLAGAATTTDGSGNVGQTQFAVKESSLPAPLPVIGLRAVTRVSQSVYLDAQGQLFQATVGGYKGSLYDLRAGATWMFGRRFGAGLGYNRFVTRLDVDRTSFSGQLRMGYSGLQLYLTGVL